jgi:6-phosphofructokinase 1
LAIAITLLNRRCEDILSYDAPAAAVFCYNPHMMRIALLTRDCGGVNAAIRAVVRTAAAEGLEVVGVVRGYEGLIAGDFVPLDRRSVSNIIGLGGTILKTAREERFCTEEGQKAGLASLRARAVDGLIVIGGNGSLAGARVLSERHGFPVVGVPATIDNDVAGVAFSIGADTAVNVALDAVDKIRDTATSLERIFVVEVMGRKCGWIAMQVALAGGCEEVLLPEKDVPLEAVCEEIKAGSVRGKASWIIVVAEGRASAAEVAEAVTAGTGLETRIAVLGHIQRGGRPTADDRIMAARLGRAAVESLVAGRTGGIVHMAGDEVAFLPFGAAGDIKRIDIESDYRLLKILS